MKTQNETARLRVRTDGKIEILAPHVGVWRPGVQVGGMVQAHASLGEIEVLRDHVTLVAPEGAQGIIVRDDAAVRMDRAQIPVDFRSVRVVLDPSGSVTDNAMRSTTIPTMANGALVVRAPSSGRFYLRPAPGKEPFVRVGDEITVGQTIALLEVMKTFNRVTYGGANLPERARVTRIAAQEDGDVATGDVLIEIEAI